jgi:hypothetical protein
VSDQTNLYVQSTRSFLERLNAPISWVISKSLQKNPLNGVYAVFISYSGHGVSVPDQNGDEVDGSDECVSVGLSNSGILSDDFWRLFSVSSSRVPKSLCWWTVAIPDLSWTYRTHTSVPLNRIFKHQLHVIQNSHDFWMYRLQTSADTFMTNAVRAKPVQWPPLFWIPSRTSPRSWKMPTIWLRVCGFCWRNAVCPRYLSWVRASSLKLHLSRFVAD